MKTIDSDTERPAAPAEPRLGGGEPGAAAARMRRFGRRLERSDVRLRPQAHPAPQTPAFAASNPVERRDEFVAEPSLRPI